MDHTLTATKILDEGSYNKHNNIESYSDDSNVSIL